jgi:Na+/melibiose symporter-like transporter
VKQDIKDVFSSKPWKAMFAVTTFIFITLALWGGGMYYYFNYFVQKEALYTFIQGVGLVNTPGQITGWGHYILDAFGLIALADLSNVFNVGFSLFNMVGQLVTIAGVILLSEPLALRFGKRNTFVVGLGLTAIFTGLFFVVPPENVGTIFVINILKSISYAPTIPLLWAMMGDVADFGEWKNHRRSTGFVYAGIVFALKAGLGIGGAICGAIVDLFGFVPNAIQTESAIVGIRLVSSLVPAVTFGIGVIALFFYPITKELNETVQAELSDRRAKQAELSPKTVEA